MTTRAPDILKVLASASLLVLGSITTANAQVRPNPPSNVFIEGGTTVPSANLLFFDDFNYAVDTNPANAAANTAAFLAAGWTGAKAGNLVHGQGGTERLSTVTASQIPGFSGSLPASSPRALRINSNALTAGGQTDFFLQLGNNTTNSIPGNVWFQFWLYPNRSGAEQTGFHSREKFLYPTQASSYPSGDNRWMWVIGSSSHNPFGAAVPEIGSAWGVSRDHTANKPNDTTVPLSDRDKLGQTSRSEYIMVNRWTLVKIHYDTTGAQGIYECWMRPQGGSWTKVAEWIGGVTPGFIWDIPAQDRGGHHAIKMPTTFPAANTTPQYNAWIYMQDFAMATSEASLPVYND